MTGLPCVPYSGGQVGEADRGHMMFKGSLSKEITVILVIKLFVLLLIKFIWFPPPTVPGLDPQRIVEHVLGSGEKPSEGEPR
jgi:hypothetical protein